MSVVDVATQETGAGQAAQATGITHLAVMIGEQRCLIDLPEAGEIVPMPALGAIQKVPLTRDWFLGVVNVRGTLFTVVDLARFMGGNFTPVSREARLVTMSHAMNFNTTLVVSRMLGLRNSASMTALEERAPAEKPWLARRYRDADGQTWYRLSLARLVASQSFLMVGR